MDPTTEFPVPKFTTAPECLGGALEPEKPVPRASTRLRVRPTGLEEDEFASDDEARLASITTRLKANMKILEADKVLLLNAQRQFEEKRAKFATIRADVTAVQAQLEFERLKSKRQLAADAQQNANQIKEAERRVNRERHEIEEEKARTQAKLDGEEKELQRKWAKLDAGTQWLVDENALLEDDNKRLALEKARLLDLNKSLSERKAQAEMMEENAHLERENARLLDSLSRKAQVDADASDLNQFLSKRAGLAEGFVEQLKEENANARLVAGAMRRMLQDDVGAARPRAKQAPGPLGKGLQSMPSQDDAIRSAQKQVGGNGRTSSSPPPHLSLTPSTTRTIMLPSPPSSSPAPHPRSPRKRSHAVYEDADENVEMDMARKLSRQAPVSTGAAAKTAPRPAPATAAQPPRTPLYSIGANAQREALPARELDQDALLRSVKLGEHEETPTATPSFLAAPLLQNISLFTYCDAYGPIFPWFQLTVLSVVWLDLNQCGYLLNNLVNIIYSHSYTVSTENFSVAKAGLRDVTLLYLETLVLNAAHDAQSVRGSILDKLTLPALRRLQVSQQALHSADPVATLVSLVSRSGCSLNELCVLNIPSSSRPLYQQALPSVMSLILGFRSKIHFTEPFLEEWND
ncbi:hypothetical protein B0H19DRAFT_1247907 [Mycena capillaripes]|nr:hypothetical protein B0H19DRAFT_1247907 [Mycena capillaripes]